MPAELVPSCIRSRRERRPAAEPLGFLVALLGVALVLAFSAPVARAQVAITLPLGGYYHPGRYMPVRVSVPSGLPAAQNLALMARGAMTTRLPLDRSANVLVVPWLVYNSQAQSLQWSLAAGGRAAVTPVLRPLSPGQRLLGVAADAEAARVLFPLDDVIIVELDPANPLPGPAAAWEALDAVALDGPQAARLGDQKIAGLISGGVAIVVRSEARPDNTFPWHKQGDCWVLRHVSAGPAAAAEAPPGEGPFSPVASWQSGWPADFRRTIVLIACFFAIGSLAIVLWRPPLHLPILLLATAGGLVALRYWWHFQIPIQECAGQVMVVDAEWTQSDYWAYQTAASWMPADVRWVDATTKLVFEDPRQLEAFAPTLVCYANGDPRLIRYDIPAHGKIALLTRSVGPRPRLVPPENPVTSPLLPMIEKLYLTPGDRVAGQYASAPVIGSGSVRTEQWPSVVVERGAEEKR